MYVVDITQSWTEWEVSGGDRSNLTPSPLLRHCSRAILAEEEMDVDNRNSTTTVERPDAPDITFDALEDVEAIESCVVSRNGSFIAACGSGAIRKL